jgi:hypothetical protein
MVTRPAPAQRADTWISRIATTTVAGLAGTAGAISYSHMRQLAAAHGDTGWHAHAFPLSVDGVEIVASLVLLADRRAGRKSGWLPWTALAIGTAASLAANIATAEAGTVSRIIAGWPAFALLIAVKLLSGILEHRGTADPASLPDGRERDGQSRPAPAVRSARCPDPDGRPSVRPQPPAEPLPDPDRPRRRAVRPAASIDDLLPAACAVRDDLRTAGRPITRDALAARLRAAGYRIGNDKLTPLLLAIKDPAAA